MEEISEQLENNESNEVAPIDTRQIITGRELRRRYIFEQRKIYIKENGVFPTTKAELEVMETFAKHAKVLYPNKGTYLVDSEGNAVQSESY